MTPQEAADLAVACTATGQSGLPLWEFMPGMLTLPWTTADGRFVHPAWRVGDPPHEWPSVYFAFRTCRWEDDARPDFSDALTVQALWLLVRRAYVQHPIILHTPSNGSDTPLPPGSVEIVINEHRVPPLYRASGPDYAVFTRALAKAPTR